MATFTILSDVRNPMTEGEFIAFGIRFGEHLVVVTDKEEGDSQWREYYIMNNGIKVYRCSPHGASIIAHVGDYNDWQIRQGVEEMAKFAHIIIPPEMWYEDNK